MDIDQRVISNEDPVTMAENTKEQRISDDYTVAGFLAAPKVKSDRALNSIVGVILYLIGKNPLQ